MLVKQFCWCRIENAAMTYHQNCQPQWQLLIKLVTGSPFLQFRVINNRELDEYVFTIVSLPNSHNNYAPCLFDLPSSLPCLSTDSQSPPISHTIQSSNKLNFFEFFISRENFKKKNCLKFRTNIMCVKKAAQKIIINTLKRQTEGTLHSAHTFNIHSVHCSRIPLNEETK